MTGPRRPEQFRLDWRAYFRAFSEAHGGDPVEHGGRLLFADGWQYSSTDHAGPEWPAPEDEQELRRLQTYYWNRRLWIVRTERNKLYEKLKGLEELQGTKSVALQTVARQPDEAGRSSVKRGPLDLAGMQARLAWLKADVQWCESQLEGIRSGSEGGNEQTAQSAIDGL